MPRHMTRQNHNVRERGFSLIELLVVMAVIAVLMSIAVMAFRSARYTVNTNEARTVGSAYMQAVSQYQADHANLNPTLTGSSPSADIEKGPLNLLNKPYLKSIPDAISHGRIGVSMGGANCSGTAVAGAGSRVGWVSVCYGPPPQHYVRVAARRDPSAATWTICYMGSTTATPKC